MTRSIITVSTSAGDFHIDVDASEENGMFDREIENGPEAIAAVRAAIVGGNALLNATGQLTLVVGPAAAYTFKRD